MENIKVFLIKSNSYDAEKTQLFGSNVTQKNINYTCQKLRITRKKIQASQ